MSDLVKRLRKRWDWSNDEATTNDMIDERAEAADHIAALEAALAKADAALKECMDEIDDYIRQEYPIDHPVHERYRQRDFSANPARVYFEARKLDA